jgi:hypothetical protein
MSGSEARVFMFGGDVIVGVVRVGLFAHRASQLRVVHLYIDLSFSGLVP